MVVVLGYPFHATIPGPTWDHTPFHTPHVSWVVAGSTWYIFGGVNGSRSTLLATRVELPGQPTWVIFQGPVRTPARQ